MQNPREFYGPLCIVYFRGTIGSSSDSLESNFPHHLLWQKSSHVGYAACQQNLLTW
jgi:hypothetical protein